MTSIIMSSFSYHLILLLCVSLATATTICVPGSDDHIQYCSVKDDSDGVVHVFPPQVKKATTLYLNRSAIRDISSTAFDMLVNLRYLHLDNNKLGKVSPEWFKKLGNLLEIDLSENRIMGISDKIFSHCSKLNYVNLSRNFIERLSYPSDDFKNAIVDLSMNPLIEFEIGSVYSLHLNRTHLSTLHLSNDFVQLYAENSRISSFYAAKSERILVLDLAGNKLTSIANITALKGGGPAYLDLSRNPIGTQNPDAFLNLNRLRHLNLSQCNILNLFYGQFANQEDLKVLDLSKNHLWHLNANHFRRIRNNKHDSIDYLYVQNNPIFKITDDKILLYGLSKFVFGGNSLDLDCEKVLNLYTTLKRNDIIFIPDHLKRFDVNNVDGIGCTDPS